jgi:hypothetical protein
MGEDIKSKFEAVFQKHAASKLAAAKAQDVKESKWAAFLRAFLDARETTIRPAMTEVGEYVRGNGYHYEISTVDDSISNDKNHRPISAAIRITFFTGDDRAPVGNFPHFTVICDKERQRVGFHESTISPGRGGHAGGVGGAPLSELTTEMVQEKIIKVLSEAFK